jgi:energy-coupling factor transport system permease protein
MATSARLYASLAIAVLLTRVIFRLIFNYETAATSAERGFTFGLPRIDLSLGPLGEISLFGELSLASMAAATTEGLRLAAIILSAGLANTLANPKRLIGSIPASLYELAIAISIAMNFAPALISGFERVRRVQKLRGNSTRQNVFSRILIPVLEDSISQSFQLAASMASRGFGRRIDQSSKRMLAFRAFSFLSLCSLGLSAVLWIFTDGIQWSFASLCLGVAVAAVAIRISTAKQTRTKLQPLKFGSTDWLIAGLCIGVTTFASIGWLS